MKQRAATAGIVAGVALMAAGAGVCVIGMPVAMMHAFNELGRAGVADPNALAGSISQILGFTIWGNGMYFAGLVVFVISLVAKMRAARLIQ